jgi:hypothetical protein
MPKKSVKPFTRKREPVDQETAEKLGGLLEQTLKPEECVEEIETPDGRHQVRVDDNGRIIVCSISDDSQIIITPYDQLSRIAKNLSPDGTMYEITTYKEGGDGNRCAQKGVCYVGRDGLMVESPMNVSVKPRSR